jgi:hypothetical protein
MKINRVIGVFWSATGNTRQLVLNIGSGLASRVACDFQEVDFTPKAAREQTYSFREGDVVIVGSPTYAGKLPNKILPDFQEKLKGNGAVAVAVVTYGNRSFDNSLAELKHTLEADGFFVAGAAAFACRHAFTDMLGGGRPSKEDFAEAEEFQKKLAVRLQGENPSEWSVSVPGNPEAPYYVPLGTDGQPAKFLKAKPMTDMEACTNCGICVGLCPMQSISAEHVSQVPGICIKCQACVRGCPEGAKYFDDPAFLSHVEMLTLNYASPLKENRFFL